MIVTCNMGNKYEISELFTVPFFSASIVDKNNDDLVFKLVEEINGTYIAIQVRDDEIWFNEVFQYKLADYPIFIEEIDGRIIVMTKDDEDHIHNCLDIFRMMDQEIEDYKQSLTDAKENDRIEREAYYGNLL